MIDNSLMFELGAIMLIAFIGAALASKGRQSVIPGYMAVGILIGPYIHFELFGFTYDGVVTDVWFITALSQIGLILLLFFVGLEFSVDKIRRVKGPAVILSIIDVGVNLFTGIVLAAGLGWPLIDSIFLAAVLAMSCSAVAMKTLMELGRLNRPETEFMLGMIVMEEFISMVFLTVVGGLLINTSGFSPLTMMLGMLAFFAFFVVMAVLVIPRTVSKLQKMQSDELFVLFMLGVIFLSAALAEICHVPPLIGAFFIGMVFAETKVMGRMEKKIAPLRDVFVAIFFVSFGMLIDPAMFGATLGVIIVAVVLVIVDEILVMSAIAYLTGFSRRAAASIGASFSARGGESVMYASVGSSAAGATKGAELSPIAGAVTFIMGVLCSLFIRKSYDFADWTSRRAPRFLKFGSAIISRTMGKLVLPSSLKLHRISSGPLLFLLLDLVLMIAIIATNGIPHLLAFALGAALVLLTWRSIGRELRMAVRKVDYSNLGAVPGNQGFIARYITSVLCLGLMTCMMVAFMFPIYWPSVAVLSLAYLVWVIWLMKMAYDTACESSEHAKRPGPAGEPSAPKAPADEASAE